MSSLFAKVLILMASAAVLLVAGIILSLWTARHAGKRLPTEAVPLRPAETQEPDGVGRHRGWR